MARKTGARRTGTRKTDTFCQVGYQTVTESVAGTLAFQEWVNGYSMGDDVGLIISMIMYDISGGDLNKIIDEADSILVGFCTSDQIADLALSRNSVLDRLKVTYSADGAATSAHFNQTPFIRDFSDLPEGGILVAPKPLYIAVQGASLASAVSVEARIYFRAVVLDDREFRELWETYSLIK